MQPTGGSLAQAKNGFNRYRVYIRVGWSKIHPNSKHNL